MRGYRLELKLNKHQRVLCAKSAGTARFAYNWKLRNLIDEYEKAKADAKDGKVKCNFGNSIAWHKEWVLLKQENLQYYALWLMHKHSPSGESTVSSTQSNACGDERLQFLTEQCLSMKQEFKAMHSFA